MSVHCCYNASMICLLQLSHRIVTIVTRVTTSLIRHVPESSCHLECWYYMDYCHSSLEIYYKGEFVQYDHATYHVWAPK